MEIHSFFYFLISFSLTRSKTESDKNLATLTKAFDKFRKQADEVKKEYIRKLHCRLGKIYCARSGIVEAVRTSMLHIAGA